MKNIYKIDLRFSDFDMNNHVNNAVYFSYLESARVQLFNNLLGCNWDWFEKGLILKKQNIDYIYPIRFLDDVFIEVSIVHIGFKSFELHYKLFCKDTIYAIASTLLISYDYKNNQTQNLSQELVSALKTLKSIT